MYNVCIMWYNYACYTSYTPVFIILVFGVSGCVYKCDIIHVDFILYNVYNIMYNVCITWYNYACYAHYTGIWSQWLCVSVTLYTLTLYCIMSNMCIILCIMCV